MESRLLRVIAALALIAGLAACGTGASDAVGSSAPQPHLGVVHTVQDCGDDYGGFGAPVRHFADSTPFSENPFNICWPQ